MTATLPFHFTSLEVANKKINSMFIYKEMQIHCIKTQLENQNLYISWSSKIQAHDMSKLYRQVWITCLHREKLSRNSVVRYLLYRFM